MAVILNFIKLSLMILLMGHLLGCIAHFFAVMDEKEEEDAWFQVMGIKNVSWTVSYVNSLYWAITTTNTVGYGDISPKTPNEKIVGIIFLMIACGFFAFTVNSIGYSLNLLNKKKKMIKYLYFR